MRFENAATTDPKVWTPGAGRTRRSVARQSLAVLLATTALGVASAHAVDGTWTGATGEWVDGTNWSSNPDVPDGIATFTNTGTTTVANDNGVVVIGTVQFTAVPNAQAYTFNVNNPFIVNGTGIVNDSTSTQTFNVSSGNALVFQNASTASGGTGAVTINNQNGGFLNFQNTSTAGNATIVNNGIFQFNDASTAATANITNNLQLDFFEATSAGSANIANAAGGTLTFNNTATAATATIGNDGTVAFSGSSTGGSANLTNNATGILNFIDTSTAGTAIIGNDGTVTFSNSSTGGSANLTNNSGGVWSFNDTSTAGGATIVNNGDMSFNNSARAGTSAITNNAGLNFNDGASGDHATIINQNSGVIGFNGTSTADHANITNTFATTTFTDASTAGNATILNSTSGATFFSGDSTAGNANITNTGSFVFSPAFTHFLGSSTAGAATITNNAFGGTIFEGQSLAGTATIITNQDGITIFGSPGGSDTASADHANIINTAGPGGLGTGGFTEFFASTTAGNATITTGNGGAVAFFDTSSGGAARFITNAGGVFDISQLTSSGMSAGSIEGAGTYYLGDKQLTVGGNNLSTIVSGIISDGSCGCFGPGGIGGSLVKVGSGTLTLAGINTYTGATTVNGGALIVDGSTAASVLTTVNAGGTLGGSGIVGNTAITGGTLAPGSAGGSTFGPLTVQGSLSFTAASTYMIQVTPANAGRTNVNGAATLGGATVSAVFAPGSYVERQYTILNATGGLGGSTFNPAVSSNMANIQSTLSYDANNAFLNIRLAFVPPPGVVLNVNQQNVANTLVNFFNVNGSIPAAFAGLNAGGLTIASGELGTGVIQSSIKADDLFLNLLLDPSVAGRAGGFAPVGTASRFADDDEALAYAAKRTATPSERDAFAMARKAPSLLAAQPANRWSVWGAAYGGSATTDGNAAVGSHDTSARVYGVVAGADYKVSPDTLLGFALAGGGTSYTLSDGLGRGSSDLFQAGVFGRHNFGAGYVSAALAYGWHDVTTNRTVALAGLDQLQGRFKAETFSGRFEGGYRFATPMVGITPYAAAQVISFNLPAYAEQSLAGGALFALNYASQTTTATRTELGLRSDKSIAMQDAVLTLRGRAAWAHDYNPDRAVTAVFQALPGASFVVNGARGNPDAALVSAGAEMKWLNGFSLMATFEGEFSGNTTSYAGKGVARYTW